MNRQPSSDLIFGLQGFLRPKTCLAGTVLIDAEQPGEIAYIILEGTVKVYVEQAGGRNVILAILGPGQLVGEMSLADRGDCSATVVTLEEARLLWIDHADFETCLQTKPDMCRIMVKLLSSRLRLANAQIQSLATLDATGRVARQLLAFAREYGRPLSGGGIQIPIRLTQDDLADLVGATRVHVNRVIAEYKRRRVLSIDQHHYITVHNAADLARHSE